jgi:hypothetical protein
MEELHGEEKKDPRCKTGTWGTRRRKSFNTEDPEIGTQRSQRRGGGARRVVHLKVDATGRGEEEEGGVKPPLQRDVRAGLGC